MALFSSPHLAARRQRVVSCQFFLKVLLVAVAILSTTADDPVRISSARKLQNGTDTTAVPSPAATNTSTPATSVPDNVTSTAPSPAPMAGNGTVCTSPNNTFTVKVNLHSSELGYYTFEECGDMISPTIAMEVGQTYTFLQTDRSNYYHPLGFAYFPDGAHDGVDELEPGIGLGSNASCKNSTLCPAPMYMLNGDNLGNYSNVPGVAPLKGHENFGLDEYEPLFFRPMPEWAGNELSIKLRFDDASYNKDIFYFCHIHQFMSGRIKLMRNGEMVSAADDPPLGYTYEQPGAFDESCGTYGLGDFQLPHPECPSTFVCNPSTESAEFASCINAMNCHMFVGMTTGVSSKSDIALFIHQMIPHHQNAVNMAKTLLDTGAVPCENLTNDEDPLCVMQTILYEIVNGQPSGLKNFQIQSMRGVLEDLDLPATDDCSVPIPIAAGNESNIFDHGGGEVVVDDSNETPPPSSGGSNASSTPNNTAGEPQDNESAAIGFLTAKSVALWIIGASTSLAGCAVF